MGYIENPDYTAGNRKPSGGRAKLLRLLAKNRFPKDKHLICVQRLGIADAGAGHFVCAVVTCPGAGASTVPLGRKSILIFDSLRENQFKFFTID